MPSDNDTPPQLHEGYVKNALDYVRLAERVNGPIPRPVGFDYIWGDALAELAHYAPDLRIVNLETAVTRSEDWEAKGINYRMHPDNLGALSAAGVDCCVLANNHVLDWGVQGLRETLTSLRGAGIHTAGAGPDRARAHAPAALSIPGAGRVLVFARAAQDSGVPRHWAAQARRPGVALLDELSVRAAAVLADEIAQAKAPGDLAVVSLHWGGNWGYGVPGQHRRFAHALIEAGAADIVHGHSSHHVKAMEVYRGHPILYGCGDLLTDYEGIGGYEHYRGDLGLMYFVTMEAATGRLLRIEMSPTRMRGLRINRASPADAEWLRDVLERESRRFGVQVALRTDGRLQAHWSG